MVVSTFSERLKYARAVAGLEQSEIAVRLTISQGAISQWESGGRNPRLHYYRKLAEILECDVGWLYNGEGNKPHFTGLAQQEEKP